MISVVDLLSLSIAASEPAQNPWAIWLPIAASGIALYFSWKNNVKITEANATAKRAVEKSEEANSISAEALTASKESNLIAREANEIAQKAIRLEESRQPKIGFVPELQVLSYLEQSGSDVLFVRLRMKILNIGDVPILFSKVSYGSLGVGMTDYLPGQATSIFGTTIQPKSAFEGEMNIEIGSDRTSWKINLLFESHSFPAMVCKAINRKGVFEVTALEPVLGFVPPRLMPSVEVSTPAD